MRVLQGSDPVRLLLEASKKDDMRIRRLLWRRIMKLHIAYDKVSPRPGACQKDGSPLALLDQPLKAIVAQHRPDPFFYRRALIHNQPPRTQSYHIYMTYSFHLPRFYVRESLCHIHNFTHFLHLHTRKSMLAIR